MRKRSMFFLKTPYLCDLDTARYKGRLQSRNPGMTGISLHIDQHTNNKTPATVEQLHSTAAGAAALIGLFTA